MKHRETRKAVSMTTTIAIAVLATVLAFPTMTTVAIAQSSSNDFQEFMADFETTWRLLLGNTGNTDQPFGKIS